MEKEKDITNRIDGFRKDYQELIKKYQVDLTSYPVFVPNANGVYQVSVNVQIVDTKYLPIPPLFRVSP
jgi:hypothetical protein